MKSRNQELQMSLETHEAYLKLPKKKLDIYKTKYLEYQLSIEK